MLKQKAKAETPNTEAAPLWSYAKLHGIGSPKSKQSALKPPVILLVSIGNANFSGNQLKLTAILLKKYCAQVTVLVADTLQHYYQLVQGKSKAEALALMQQAGQQWVEEEAKPVFEELGIEHTFVFWNEVTEHPLFHGSLAQVSKDLEEKTDYKAEFVTSNEKYLSRHRNDAPSRNPPISMDTAATLYLTEEAAVMRLIQTLKQQALTEHEVLPQFSLAGARGMVYPGRALPIMQRECTNIQKAVIDLDMPWLKITFLDQSPDPLAAHTCALSEFKSLAGANNTLGIKFPLFSKTHEQKPVATAFINTILSIISSAYFLDNIDIKGFFNELLSLLDKYIGLFEEKISVSLTEDDSSNQAIYLSAIEMNTRYYTKILNPNDFQEAIRVIKAEISNAEPALPFTPKNTFDIS